MLIKVGQLLARLSFGTRSALLIGGGNDGFAFDATDLSVWIKDSGTPANDYNVVGNLTGFSAPFTYTSPSPKMIRHDDGLIKYNAHNLFSRSDALDQSPWVNANSAVAADAVTAPGGYGVAEKITPNTTLTSLHSVYQSMSLTAGATYRWAVVAKAAGKIRLALYEDTITGWYSVFDLNSGTVINDVLGATGSIESLGDGWYLCSLTVTVAGNGTLHIVVIDDAHTTLTSWSGDNSNGIYVTAAHLHRYPADDTYVATTSTAKYLLPVEYDTSAAALGVLVEPQVTNLVLYGSDLTNAAWTASNMTTAKTATGPGGAANSATTITASAGNATLLQAITSASAARLTSCYIKRRTGSGNIDLTQDNGATWTTQTVTSEWTRVALASVTSTDPTVGIRVVTSGDAVDVALFQHETGTVATSPIETFSATVTRAIDLIKLPESECTFSDTAGTLYAVFTARDPATASRIMQLNNADADDYVDMNLNAGALGSLCDGPGVDVTGDATVSADTETAVAYGFTDGDQGIAIDGTIQLADAEALSVSFDRLQIGNSAGSGQAINGHMKAVMYRPARLADAALETLTGA